MPVYRYSTSDRYGRLDALLIIFSQALLPALFLGFTVVAPIAFSDLRENRLLCQSAGRLFFLQLHLPYQTKLKDKFKIDHNKPHAKPLALCDFTNSTQSLILNCHNQPCPNIWDFMLWLIIKYTIYRLYFPSSIALYWEITSKGNFDVGPESPAIELPHGFWQSMSLDVGQSNEICLWHVTRLYFELCCR